MKTLQIREDQLDKTIETMSKMGLRLASKSKFNVEEGYWRVTFLEEHWFNTPDAVILDKDGVPIESKLVRKYNKKE